MDAITLANSFATIIGLLVTFQSSGENSDIADFMEWLRENNNSHTAIIIENDIELQKQLSNFMSQNHNEIMSQLSTLNDLMISVASRMHGISGIASKFDDNYGLSDQALNVLREFNSSDGEYIWRLQSLGDTEYSIDASQTLNINEPRFIEDDFKTMAELNLLTHEITNQGYHRYRITRYATEYIKAIDKMLDEK